jgi:hypothetical protein
VLALFVYIYILKLAKAENRICKMFEDPPS